MTQPRTSGADLQMQIFRPWNCSQETEDSWGRKQFKLDYFYSSPQPIQLNNSSSWLPLINSHPAWGWRLLPWLGATEPTSWVTCDILCHRPQGNGQNKCLPSQGCPEQVVTWGLWA